MNRNSIEKIDSLIQQFEESHKYEHKIEDATPAEVAAFTMPKRRSKRLNEANEYALEEQNIDQKFQAGEEQRAKEIQELMAKQAKEEQAKSDAFDQQVKEGTPTLPEMGDGSGVVPGLAEHAHNVLQHLGESTYVPSGLLRTYK